MKKSYFEKDSILPSFPKREQSQVLSKSAGGQKRDSKGDKTMTKNIAGAILIVFFMASPILNAQTPVNMAELEKIYAKAMEPVPDYPELSSKDVKPCSCPLPVTAKKSVVKPVFLAKPPVVRTASVLPTIGWPDWILGVMAGSIFLLLLAVAFLIGRTSAPMQNPQVITPVVYIQPPDNPRILRP